MATAAGSAKSRCEELLAQGAELDIINRMGVLTNNGNHHAVIQLGRDALPKVKTVVHRANISTLLSQSLAFDGQGIEGEQIAREGLNLDIQDPDTKASLYSALASSLVVQQRFKESEDAAREGLRIVNNPKPKMLLHATLGAALVKQHREEEALEHSNAASDLLISISPNGPIPKENPKEPDFKAILFVTKMLREQRNYKQVVQVGYPALKAVVNPIHKAEISNHLAFALNKLDRHEEAIQVARDAVILDGIDRDVKVDLFSVLSMSLFLKNAFQEAEVAAKKGLVIAKDKIRLSTLHIALANALMAQGKVAEAAIHDSLANELASTFVKAMPQQNIGEMLSLLIVKGKFSDAVRIGSEALKNEKDPRTQARISVHLASAFLKLGQLDKAERVARDALILEGIELDFKAGIFSVLSMSLFEQRRYKDAQDATQEGLEIARQQATIGSLHAILSRICKELGDEKKAENHKQIARNLLGLSKTKN